jgi:exopolysaccharide biosynthesis operon protein EpsL
VLGCALAAATPGALAQQASAVQDRPVMAVVGGNVTRDDNLFRVPEPQSPQSDRITSAYVGLRIDKSYGQQNLVIAVTETAYRYQDLKYLDFEALDYNGAWNWRLGTRLSGTLSADRSESQANYGDFRDTTQQNLRISENRAFAVDAWLAGGWHLVAGALRRSQRNSVPFTQQGSYRAGGGEAGLRYLAESGSSIQFLRRSLKADYLEQAVDAVNLIDDGFERNESELRANWLVSAKTSLRGEVARIDYRSNQFEQRDFSGTTGSIAMQWAATDRVQIDVGGARQLEAWRDATASYRADDRLSFATVWRIGAKTSIRVNLDHTASEFRNPVVAVAGPLRKDETDGVQLGLEWAPLRNLALTGSVRDEKRTSNDAAFGYRATVAGINAKLAF